MVINDSKGGNLVGYWSDEEYDKAIAEKMKEYEPHWVEAIIIMVDDY